MNINSIYYSLLLLLLSTSCEKVIDLNLPAQPPTPVIEGILLENSPPRVLVSHTMNIFDKDSIKEVTNAQVFLSDDLNQRDTLVYSGRGLYTSNNLTGTVGRTYTLEVVIDDQRYNANSTLLPTVPLDSITLELDSVNHFSTSQTRNSYYNISVHLKDPATTTNYYLAEMFYIPQNGSNMIYKRRKIAFSDRYKNGQSISIPILSTEIASGDQVIAVLYSIDQPIFEYFLSLNDATLGGSFTAAAPANPKSNFSAGALGYFQASSISTQQFFIP